MLRYCYWLIVVVLFCSTSFADQVVLINGDQLNGQVVKMEKGKMVFLADMLGEVTIDMDKIRSIQTDDSVELHLIDGNVVKTPIDLDQPGIIAFKDTETLKGQTIPLNNLLAINPPKVVPNTWSGNFRFGFDSSHGDSFDQSFNFDLDATREKIKTSYQAKSRWRNKVNYEVERSRDRDGDEFTSEENITLLSKYDHFYKEKAYVFVDGLWKKDHIADLDRRLIGGVGLGHEWINDGTILLTTDFGPAIVHERYVTPTETSTKDDVSAQIGYLFNWKITKRIGFYHQTLYFPSLERSGDYFLLSDAEIRTKISEDWFGSFKTLLDYDSTPADSSGTTDMDYIFSLGWTF